MLKGDRLLWKSNSNQSTKIFETYTIKLKLTIDEINDGSCLNYPTPKHQSYAICINMELRNRIMPVLGCMVPWMSSKDQCNNPIPRTSEHAELLKYLSTIITNSWGGIDYTNDACPLPCSLMSPHSIHVHSGH